MCGHADVHNWAVEIMFLLLERRRSLRFALGLALFGLTVPSQCAGDDGDEKEQKPKPPRTIQPAILLTSVPGRPVAGAGFVQRYGIKHADVERIQASLANVASVVPLREVLREARFADRRLNVRVIGTMTNAAAVMTLSFQRGAFFEKREVQTRNNVAVIGAGVARSLFPGTNPVGRNVRVGPNYFLIVGVLKPTKAGPKEADFDSAIFVPLTTLRSRLNLDNLDVSRRQGTFSVKQVELTQVLITVRANKSIEDTAESVREYFRIFHKKTKDVEITVIGGKR